MTMNTKFDYARPGMMVVSQATDEQRFYLKDLPPNGTMGTLLYRKRVVTYSHRFGGYRFTGVVPGVYLQDGVWIVMWEGRFKPETLNYGYIHSSNVAEVEERWHEQFLTPYKARLFTSMELDRRARNEIRVSDLPETKFYELDQVRENNFHSDSPFHADNIGLQRRISRVNYEIMSGLDPNDTRGQLYDFMWMTKEGIDGRCGSSFCSDEDSELVERGNVWKLFHSPSDVEFPSFQAEVNFHCGMAGYEEMRNPATGYYSWNRSDAIQAIREGKADCMKFEVPLVYDADHIRNNDIHTFRFADRNLGERVREAALKEIRKQDAYLKIKETRKTLS